MKREPRLKTARILLSFTCTSEENLLPDPTAQCYPSARSVAIICRMLFPSPSHRRLFGPCCCSHAEQGLSRQPVPHWEHPQSLLPGRWQAGEGGEHLSCLPACRFCTTMPPHLPCRRMQHGARTARCCPCRRRQSTVLVLIRTRQETGKVQAGVKKAQGGSLRISLTSRRVQPQCSAATGTLQ